MVVELDNGVSLDFHDTDQPITSQHYAFLIDEADFDAVLGPDPRSRSGPLGRSDDAKAR